MSTGFIRESGFAGVIAGDFFIPPVFVVEYNTPVIGFSPINSDFDSHSKPTNWSNLAGFLPYTWPDIFFNRIIVSPEKLDVGNVSSISRYEVWVTNGYFKPLNLDKISFSDEGFKIIGTKLTGKFSQLDGFRYQIEIDTKGPFIIDDVVLWDFAELISENDGRCKVSGTRISIIPFEPHQPAKETVNFSTTIDSGFYSEQRHSIQDIPGGEIEYQWLLNRHEISRLQRIAANGMQSAIGLPLWWQTSPEQVIKSGQVEIPVNTTNVDLIKDGQAFIWQSPELYEVATISALTQNTITLSGSVVNDYDNALVMPLMSGYADNEIKVSRMWRDRAKSSGRFIFAAVPYHPQEKTDRYLDADILLDDNIVTEAIPEDIQRKLDRIRYPGGQMHFAPATNYSQTLSKINLTMLNRDSAYTTMSWLHNSKGRFAPFWLPTWSNDIRLAKPYQKQTRTLIISPIGLAGSDQLMTLLLLTIDNQVGALQGKCTGIDVDGNEVIEMTRALTFDVALNNQDHGCRMRYMRFDNDKLTMTHQADQHAKFSAAVIEVPNMPEDKL